MPKLVPPEELESIQRLVEGHPEGLGVDAVFAALGKRFPLRNLQRRLASLVKAGRLQRQGRARATLYARAPLGDVQARQAAIYRAMTPAQRLEQALRMNRQMRSLMEAALRVERPEWTPEQRRRVIAERILHARTG